MVANRANYENSCVFEIDAADRIVSCSDAWDTFARENFGDGLGWDLIGGRVFWDLIEDPSEADIYRRLVAEARDGRVVKFRYRCATSGSSTLFQMTIELLGEGRIRFSTDTSKIITQEHSQSEDRDGSSSLLIICSWCGRLKTDGKSWQRIDLAVKRIGLFEKRPMPPVSHGICLRCLKDVNKRLRA